MENEEKLNEQNAEQTAFGVSEETQYQEVPEKTNDTAAPEQPKKQSHAGRNAAIAAGAVLGGAAGGAGAYASMDVLNPKKHEFKNEGNNNDSIDKEQLKDELREEMRDELNGEMREELKEELREELREEIHEEVKHETANHAAQTSYQSSSRSSSHSSNHSSNHSASHTSSHTSSETDYTNHNGEDPMVATGGHHSGQNIHATNNNHNGDGLDESIQVLDIEFLEDGSEVALLTDGETLAMVGDSDGNGFVDEIWIDTNNDREIQDDEIVELEDGALDMARFEEAYIAQQIGNLDEEDPEEVMQQIEEIEQGEAEGTFVYNPEDYNNDAPDLTFA